MLEWAKTREEMHALVDALWAASEGDDRAGYRQASTALVLACEQVPRPKRNEAWLLAVDPGDIVSSRSTGQVTVLANDRQSRKLWARGTYAGGPWEISYDDVEFELDEAPAGGDAA